MLQRALSNKYFIKGVCLLILASFSGSALAYGAMPWAQGLEAFAQSLCGPTAKAVGVLAFAISGIAIALGEVKGWIHNIMIVMIGVSIAILAPTVLTLLGTSSSIACG
jgi:type IV secretory pathway VirB2 component (pilin)